MIKYKIDIIKQLKLKGLNTGTIRKEKILTENQLQQIRENKLVTQTVLDKICQLLNCQPGDLLEYVPDTDTKIEESK